MRRSTALIMAGVLVVGAGVLGTKLVLDGMEDDAAEAVAERYAAIIESGDADDLEELLGLTANVDRGALRTAGDLLVEAEERIEVESVGNARDVQRSAVDVDIELSYDRLVAFDVEYRLAGNAHTRGIVLAKLEAESGRDEGDWRVVDPLTGSIDWKRGGISQADSDLYLSGIRLERMPRAIGSESMTQPLYPAVYESQRRLDPYYASEPGTIAVPAGGPVSAPALEVEPTARTMAMLTRDARQDVARCAYVSDLECPVADLAEDLGADVEADNSWFLGLVGTPTVAYTDAGMVVTGSFRFRSDDGPRRIRFTATTRTYLDSTTQQPYLDSFTAQRVLR